jgi:hypothetical protein
MNSNMPKTVAPCAASYRSEQVPGAVLIFAQGVHPTSGYVVFFERSPLTISPPQFSLWHVNPSGIVLEVITPFSKYTSFTAKEKIDTVVIYDANGKHEVAVEQVPDALRQHSG